MAFLQQFVFLFVLDCVIGGATRLFQHHYFRRESGDTNGGLYVACRRCLRAEQDGFRKEGHLRPLSKRSFIQTEQLSQLTLSSYLVLFA